MALMEPMVKKTIETIEVRHARKAYWSQEARDRMAVPANIRSTLSHTKQNEGSLMNKTTVYKSEEYEGI